MRHHHPGRPIVWKSFSTQLDRAGPRCRHSRIDLHSDRSSICAMNLRPFVSIILVGLTGCNTATTSRRGDLSPGGNQVEFDRYVEQRSSTLLAMGAFKNASEAHAKAYSEASTRYGARPGDTATIFLGIRRSEPVDTAKLDEIARRR